MRKIIVVSAVLLGAALFFLGINANANQIAANAGGDRLWILIDGADGSWTELTTPMTGASYDVVLDQLNGAYGLSFAARATGTETDLLSEYAVEYWKVEPGLEWFVGIQADVWGEGFTGDTEFLGGMRSGVRFDVGSVPFEVSGQYAVGDGVKQAGIFFGLRLAQELGGE